MVVFTLHESTLYISVSEDLLKVSSKFSARNIRVILEKYSSAQISVCVCVHMCACTHACIWVCTNTIFQSLQANIGLVPQLGHDCILPDLFQFLNHPTIQHC